MSSATMLARFERLVEQAVEGSLRRVFSSPLQPVQIAKAAARAMEQAQIVGVRGPEVPNRYEVRLAAVDLERFGDYASTLTGQVTDYLIEYAQDRGLRLVAQPHAELVADSDMRAGSMRVHASFANLTPARERDIEAALEGTRRLRLAELAAAGTSNEIAAAASFSLVDQDGLRFALEPQVGIVRLGRAADNDVVSASGRVSRYHAQLRWVESSWLVYDLESTNGTWLADERVVLAQPRRLAPGARLRLGDHELEVRSEA